MDDETKGLIVDQTIEKVSFCAPDRNHERGFSYICRDGTTRRWMCHGFLASKDSGERLSHAVGCAFAVCLERKQRRDKECGVTMAFDVKNSTFTRNGSFRQQTITERMLANERSVDALPPSMMVTPQPKPFNPFAIERPHATATMMERQGSFRGLGSLGSTSPFKRQMSLRLSDLPSNAERQRAFLDLNASKGSAMQLRSVSPIPEVVPVAPSSTVSQLCQEMSEELTLMTGGATGLMNGDTRLDQNMISLMQSAPTSPIQINSSNVDKITQMSVFTNPTMNGIPQQTQGYAATFTTTTLTTTTTSSIVENHNNNNNNEDKFANNNLPALPSPPTSTIPTTNGQMVAEASTLRTNGVLTTRMSGASSAQEISSPLQRVLPMTVEEPTAVTAEQWLNRVTTTTTTNATPSPKRPPSLSNASRTKSLNGADPFDAEWAAPIATSDVHNTNPFISPPKPPAKSFQVQL